MKARELLALVSATFHQFGEKKIVATLDTQSLEGPLRNILWSFTERNSKTMLFKPTNNEKFVCAPFWPQALEMLTLRGYLADGLNIIIKLFSINRTGGQFELKMMKYDTKIVLLLLNSFGYKNYRIHTRKS